MRIEISSAEILHRVRDIAQDELAATTQDETLRYKIEPGTEKEDKVKTFIGESFENLGELLWRFLSVEGQGYFGSVENSATVLPQKYVFDFDISERRAAGKASILTAKCATVIVQDTLARHYESVGQTQLAQNHAQLAAAEQKNISKLLYTKALP